MSGVFEVSFAERPGGRASGLGLWLGFAALMVGTPGCSDGNVASEADPGAGDAADVSVDSERILYDGGLSGDDWDFVNALQVSGVPERMTAGAPFEPSCWGLDAWGTAFALPTDLVTWQVEPGDALQPDADARRWRAVIAGTVSLSCRFAPKPTLDAVAEVEVSPGTAERVVPELDATEVRAGDPVGARCVLRDAFNNTAGVADVAPTVLQDGADIDGNPDIIRVVLAGDYEVGCGTSSVVTPLRVVPSVPVTVDLSILPRPPRGFWVRGAAVRAETTLVDAWGNRGGTEVFGGTIAVDVRPAVTPLAVGWRFDDDGVYRVEARWTPDAPGTALAALLEQVVVNGAGPLANCTSVGRAERLVGQPEAPMRVEIGTSDTHGVLGVEVDGIAARPVTSDQWAVDVVLRRGMQGLSIEALDGQGQERFSSCLYGVAPQWLGSDDWAEDTLHVGLSGTVLDDDDGAQLGPARSLLDLWAQRVVVDAPDRLVAATCGDGRACADAWATVDETEPGPPRWSLEVLASESADEARIALSWHWPELSWAPEGSSDPASVQVGLRARADLRLRVDASGTMRAEPITANAWQWILGGEAVPLRPDDSAWTTLLSAALDASAGVVWGAVDPLGEAAAVERAPRQTPGEAVPLDALVQLSGVTSHSGGVWLRWDSVFSGPPTDLTSPGIASGDLPPELAAASGIRISTTWVDQYLHATWTRGLWVDWAGWSALLALENELGAAGVVDPSVLSLVMPEPPVWAARDGAWEYQLPWVEVRGLSDIFGISDDSIVSLAERTRWVVTADGSWQMPYIGLGSMSLHSPATPIDWAAFRFVSVGRERLLTAIHADALQLVVPPQPMPVVRDPSSGGVIQRFVWNEGELAPHPGGVTAAGVWQATAEE